MAAANLASGLRPVNRFLLHSNNCPVTMVFCRGFWYCTATRRRRLIVKKYSNRRLYDTVGSRYITLEELAEKIRAGADVKVLDAKSNEDLTQGTLTQIILESRGAARLLPVPLLLQLIRMGDDALAEFFGRFLSTALEVYSGAKQGAAAISPYNPFANVPFAATNALARLLLGGANTFSGWSEPSHPPAPPAAAPQQTPPPAAGDDVAAMRRELDELKRSLKPRRKGK
jgi:polyhydroxyalkanoate synthesis repressor PhaR